MKKMFVEDLPKKGKMIDWNKSVGCSIRFIYEDVEGEVLISSYKNNVLGIKYLDEDIYYIQTGEFRQCGLGKLLKKITKDFKLEVGTNLKDEKRDLVIIDRFYKDMSEIYKKKRIFKYYKYKCNKCGWDEGLIDEWSLLKGVGCSCCRGLTVVEGINDIPTTAPWMVKYFQGGYEEAKKYTKSSNKKIYPICPDCGTVKKNKQKIYSINELKSIGCACGDVGFSYPEKLMYNILNQFNIEYVMQYSPEWIKPKRYDFYIPSKNIIIEMDGGLGHGVSVHNKSTNTIEQTVNVDKYKDEMAIKNGLKVIRIDSIKSNIDYIKNNILNSELTCILDFTNVDWTLCDELSHKNIVKEICTFWNENENISTTGISKKFNISVDTIREYLHKGSRCGWCVYDGQLELKKAVARQFNIKPYNIEVYKDNKLIEVFENFTDLERRSLEVLGCKVYRRSVNIRNNKESKFYGKDFKGYTFKYVEI